MNKYHNLQDCQSDLFYIPHCRVLKSHGEMEGVSGRLAHVMLHQGWEGGEPCPVDPIHAALHLDDAVHHLLSPNPAQDVPFSISDNI